MSNVAVFVPTFRRPKQLIETLASLAQQDISDRFLLFVADNDQPLAEGAQAAVSWAESAGFVDRLFIVAVPERGLSRCRNAGLAAVFRNPQISTVAMIDDDAIAEPHWLRRLLEARDAYNADLVGGPVIYSFPAHVPAWIRQNSIYGVPYSQSGLVRRLRSTNNVLLTRSVVEHFQPDVFASAFDHSGGEDTHFFARCQERGFPTAWTTAAIVHEPVGEHRSSEQWILLRHQNSGANAARVDVMLYGMPRALFLQMVLIIKEACGGTLKAMSLDPQTRFYARMRFRGILGRVSGLLGLGVSHI